MIRWMIEWIRLWRKREKPFQERLIASAVLIDHYLVVTLLPMVGSEERRHGSGSVCRHCISNESMNIGGSFFLSCNVPMDHAINGIFLNDDVGWRCCQWRSLICRCWRWFDLLTGWRYWIWRCLDVTMLTSVVIEQTRKRHGKANKLANTLTNAMA